MSVERPSGKRWAVLRNQVIQESLNACAMCGRVVPTPDLHIHHCKALVDGGSFWNRDNLVCVCRQCHVDRHKLDRFRRTDVNHAQRIKWQKFCDRHSENKD